MPEIALHILDLVQNCITALARHIRIRVSESMEADSLEVEIADDGKGMEESFLKKVVSPFTTTRTTRKVGLGIPLLKEGCESTGGSFGITSKVGKGTTITGRYVMSHIDRPPLGDFAGTVHSIIVCNPDLDFQIVMESDTGKEVLDTEEVRKQIGDIPLNDPEVSVWLKEYLQEACEETGLIQ